MISSDTTDSLIYSALFRVDLQNQYFQTINEPRDDDSLEALRAEFVSARRRCFSRYLGSWSYRRAKLIPDPELPTGYFRQPNDLISWHNPIPTEHDVDQNGITIYKLSNSSFGSGGEISIQYIFDRDDLRGCPEEFVEVVKWTFLSNIATKGIFDQNKVALIMQKLQVADSAMSQVAAMDIRSRQGIFANLPGML